MGAQAIPALLLVTLYFVHLRGIAAGPLGDHALEGWLAPYMITRPLGVWLGFVGFHSMLVGNAWAAPAALFTLGTGAYAAWRRDWSPVVIMTASGFALAAAGAALQVYPFGPTRHTAWLLVFVIPALAWALGALLTSGRAALTWMAPIVVLGMLAVPLARTSSRQGRYGKLFIAIVIYFLYNNAVSIAGKLIERGDVSPVIGVWPVHGFMCLVVAVLIFNQAMAAHGTAEGAARAARFLNTGPARGVVSKSGEDLTRRFEEQS